MSLSNCPYYSVEALKVQLVEFTNSAIVGTFKKTLFPVSDKSRLFTFNFLLTLWDFSAQSNDCSYSKFASISYYFPGGRDWRVAAHYRVVQICVGLRLEKVPARGVWNVIAAILEPRCLCAGIYSPPSLITTRNHFTLL